MKAIKTLGLMTLVVAVMLTMFFVGVNYGRTSAVKAESEAVALEATTEQKQDIDPSVSAEANRELYTQLDYGDDVTYVIGHKSPDSDTVLSAMAMSTLLNELGIKSEPRICSKPNAGTIKFFTDYNISLPEILDDASGTQLWLVDHSTYSQAVNGAEDARIIGIVDHHGIGNVEVAEQIFVSSSFTGSTASQIWKLFQDCEITIDKQTAQILLAAILDDTQNLKTAKLVDTEAYNSLKPIAEIQDTDKLYSDMNEARLSYFGMSDEEIFSSDLKWYDCDNCEYCIGNTSVNSVDMLDDMCLRMNAVLNNIELSSNKVAAFDFSYDRGYNRLVILIKSIDPELTEGLIEALSKADGFKSAEGNAVIIEPSVSRKVISPLITDYLNSLPAEAFGTYGS